MSHTPGPWRHYTMDEAQEVIVTAAPGVTNSDPKPSVIDVTGPNRVADAALVLAAPELLRMLESMSLWAGSLLASLDAEHRGNTSQDTTVTAMKQLHNANKRAHAVSAKARGNET